MNIRFYGKSMEGGSNEFMDRVQNYSLTRRMIHRNTKSNDKLNSSATQITISLDHKYDIRSNRFKTYKQIDVIKNRMGLIQQQELKSKHQIVKINTHKQKLNLQQKSKIQDQIIKEQKYLKSQEELRQKQTRNQQFRIKQKQAMIDIKEQLQRQRKYDMLQIKKERERNEQKILFDKQQHYLNQQSRRRVVQDSIMKSQQRIDQFWIEKAVHQKQEQLKDIASDDIALQNNVKILMELNQQEQQLLENLKNTEYNLQIQLGKI